jgi:ComF family protein
MQVMTMMNIERVKWLQQQICDGLTELIFPTPELCPVCRQEKSYHRGIGKNCLQKIALVAPPICTQCGRPQRLEVYFQQLCKQCRETRYYFSEARAVAVYESSLREILAELKYRYRPELGEVLGKLLVEWVKLHRNFQDFKLIIPIPINDQKLEQRGYNQAELLAKPLQRYLGIPLANDIMVREKITESQNALCKEERFRNMQGAFRVVTAGRLAGAKVLLIDDILTTGATASEAARVLLRAGALEVKVLTVAVGIIDSQWF